MPQFCLLEVCAASGVRWDSFPVRSFFAFWGHRITDKTKSHSTYAGLSAEQNVFGTTFVRKSSWKTANEILSRFARFKMKLLLQLCTYWLSHPLSHRVYVHFTLLFAPSYYHIIMSKHVLISIFLRLFVLFILLRAPRNAIVIILQIELHLTHTRSNRYTDTYTHMNS